MSHFRFLVIVPSAVILVLFAVLWPVSRPIQAAAPQVPDIAVTPERALVDRYCVTCHSERLKTAGIVLEKLPMDPARLGDNPELWEKVLRKLQTGAMPPAGLPRPDAPSRNALISHIETSLDRAAVAHPRPGNPVIHRLNRAEYANTIRDLLALDIDVRQLLPGDEAAQNGFDNMAEALSLPPALLERYLSAARKIARAAMGSTVNSQPASEIYRLPETLLQDTRMSDALPFGSRGGAAIRHRFPVDGEYEIKIRLQRNVYEYVRGLGEPHRMDIRLDGIRVGSFTVGGEDKGLPAPMGFGGAIVGSPSWEKWALEDVDAGLRVRFPAKAGSRMVAVTFVDTHWELDEVRQPPRQLSFGLANDEMQDGKPAVGNVTITGPYAPAGAGDTPSRRAILVCQPKRVQEEDACARTILKAVARRAYRRPVNAEDVEPLFAFYTAGRRQGSFDAGIQLALERILIDPDFLFRGEPATLRASAGPLRVSDVDMASRLSFFLWSSIPDEELLTLAERGQLRNPDVVERQVKRMLADRRSEALVDNFAEQWLHLRKLREAQPDPDLFPDFDENLRAAFERETKLLIGTQMRDDRGLLELLTANYTFVNDRLARHYGIQNIYGSHFRRVALADSRRAGLLGHGSLLTVTSYPNRTSPVLRGKWLLETMLGAPPPPPPPNVPSLADKGADGRPTSLRERLETHRKNPACATCHAQFDPLGFALETYDAVGSWRTIDEGTPIDPSGTLPSGVKIEGVEGLRRYLVSDPGQFVGAVTEKLLAYSIGRAVTPHDLPVVRQIVREAAVHDYRWSPLILAVVKSMPFQMKGTEE